MRRSEPLHLQSIAILESNGHFQQQGPLHFSIRYERIGWGSRLTLYRDIVLTGGPIRIEETVKIDNFAHLVLLRPWQMTAPHLDPHPNAGCRVNTSIYAQPLEVARGGETEDTRALGWCPGVVVFPLQLYLLISYKQLQLMSWIWNFM